MPWALRVLLAASLLVWTGFWACLIFDGPGWLLVSCFVAGLPGQIVSIVEGLRAER